MEDIKAMEDLVLSARQQQEEFKDTWELWNHFIYSSEGVALRVA